MGCSAVNMCPEAEAAGGSVRTRHLGHSVRWAPFSLCCHQCRGHQITWHLEMIYLPQTIILGLWKGFEVLLGFQKLHKSAKYFYY